jgi:Tfp pilus assembly protein PilX
VGECYEWTLRGVRRVWRTADACGDDGFALPLALAIILVLTIAVLSVVQFTGANSRSAELSEARQEAGGLAEAALNNAAAVIAPAPTTATLPDCTTWSAWTPVTSGEEMRWCGSYDTPTETWTVKGQGRVPNPTGPAAAAQVHTVEAQFELGQDPGAWNFVYVKPSPGMCMLVKNSFVMEAPLYVDGNLCIDNEARYGGPRLYVTGTIQTQNTGAVCAGHIPPSTPNNCPAPVPTVSVRNNSPSPSGCRFTTSGSFVLPCTPAQRIWAGGFNNDVPPITKPPHDFPGWYGDAAPGSAVRGHSCTSPDLSQLSSKFTATRMDDNNLRDNSVGVVELTTIAPYDCTQRAADGTVLGRMQWSGAVVDPADGIRKGTLTISGLIFLDGDLRISNNRRAVVNGEGVIYVNNKIVMESSSWLCGVPDCGLSWNPNVDPPHLLFLYAGYNAHPAIEVKSDAKFQGGLYAVGGLKVSNNGYVHGPAIADYVEAENGADFNPWPWFVQLPDGVGGGSDVLRLKPGSWRG